MSGSETATACQARICLSYLTPPILRTLTSCSASIATQVFSSLTCSRRNLANVLATSVAWTYPFGYRCKSVNLGRSTTILLIAVPGLHRPAHTVRAIPDAVRFRLWTEAVCAERHIASHYVWQLEVISVFLKELHLTNRERANKSMYGSEHTAQPGRDEMEIGVGEASGASSLATRMT
jgi:hypothetical protein